MQANAILFGLLLVGALLLIGAAKQMLTGVTTGREGRQEGAYSVVRFHQMPLYFSFLLVVRFVLGLVSVIAAVLLLSR